MEAMSLKRCTKSTGVAAYDLTGKHLCADDAACIDPKLPSTALTTRSGSIVHSTADTWGPRAALLTATSVQLTNKTRNLYPGLKR